MNDTFLPSLAHARQDELLRESAQRRLASQARRPRRATMWPRAGTARIER